MYVLGTGRHANAFGTSRSSNPIRRRKMNKKKKYKSIRAYESTYNKVKAVSKAERRDMITQLDMIVAEWIGRVRNG